MSEDMNDLRKDRIKRRLRSVANKIEQSSAIQTQLFGVPATGLLTIEDNAINVDLAQDCEEDNVIVTLDPPLNLITSTHYKKIISLIECNSISRAKSDDLHFEHKYIRTKMKFDFAISDIRVTSYDDPVLTTASFCLESLSSHFPTIQNYGSRTELFTLRDGTRVFLSRVESQSFTREETKVERRSYLNLEFSKNTSLRQIIDDYLNPIQMFLSLMSFENVKIISVNVGNSLIESNLYSPYFSESTKIHFSNLTLDIDSASILKNFIDHFPKYSHHIRSAFDFDNTSVVNLYPLLTEVEKAYSLYKPRGLATEFQSQASELMSTNVHYFKSAVQNAPKWSKRIKSHRTHLMHKGERIDYDKTTLQELYAIVSSLRWTFLFLLIADLSCDKKFKQQIKGSRKFQSDLKQMQESLYRGLISNEVEPKVAYTDVFYINKLAEIYKLSEEERDLMTKALKPWKDKIIVTSDM